MVRTYSFEDVSVTINHPSVGQYALYGTGLGDVTVSRSNDITTHEAASDLSILVRRHVRKDGTITINVLQSSEANDYLNKFCKYLETCNIDDFALGTLVIENPSTGETWNCRYVTHQKMPDKTYSSEANMVTYTLMAASIDLQ